MPVAGPRPLQPAFTDRVMAQVAAEPCPTPARVFVRSLLALDLGDALAALLTTWRLAFGRTTLVPSALRARSLLLLLVVAVVGSSGGALATAGALRVLGPVFDPSPPDRPPVTTPADASPFRSPDPSPSAPALELRAEPEAEVAEPAPRAGEGEQEQKGETKQEKAGKADGQANDADRRQQPAKERSGSDKADKPANDAPREQSVGSGRTPSKSSGGDGSAAEVKVAEPERSPDKVQQGSGRKSERD